MERVAAGIVAETGFKLLSGDVAIFIAVIFDNCFIEDDGVFCLKVPGTILPVVFCKFTNVF